MHELESSQNTKNMLFAVFNLLFFNILLNATCVETSEIFLLFKGLITENDQCPVMILW